MPGLVQFKIDQSDFSEKLQKELRRHPELTREVLEELERDVIGNLKRVTDFTDPVEFRSRITRYTLTIYTDDDRFFYLDEGTPGHWIRPGGGGRALAFGWTGAPGNYVSQTQPPPNQFNATRPAFQSGTVYPSFYQQVWHPGIHPRHWTDFLQNLYDDYPRQLLDRKFTEGIESVGL